MLTEHRHPVNSFAGSFVAIFLLAAFAFGCGAVPLRKEQALLEGPQSSQMVRGAIVRAMNKLRWRAETDEDGRIVASCQRGQKMIHTLITYDERSIDFEYIDSRNMDYEQRATGVWIGRKYMRWVINLRKHVERELRAGQRALARGRQPLGSSGGGFWNAVATGVVRGLAREATGASYDGNQAFIDSTNATTQSIQNQTVLQMTQ